MKIGFVPLVIINILSKKLGFCPIYLFQPFWCLTLIKIFPNYGSDENFRCQINKHRYHLTGSRLPLPGWGRGL
ncbi:hypothetical protein HanIR_Chr13g0628491 [Helianthus annuus]|nr:hypothetical protein HanIR_Chr13g0628491 [Helianthus annuus]